MHVVACLGSVVHLILDGEEDAAMRPMTVRSASDSLETAFSVGAGRHWLRLEVRDGDGKLQLLSGPLYVNFPD